MMLTASRNRKTMSIIEKCRKRYVEKTIEKGSTKKLCTFMDILCPSVNRIKINSF